MHYANTHYANLQIATKHNVYDGNHGNNTQKIAYQSKSNSNTLWYTI